MSEITTVPATTVTLRPGLSLVIDPSHATDETTTNLVESIKEHISRDKRIAEIRSELAWLVAGDDLDGLELVLESTGWLENRTETTCERLARGIEALLAVLDDAEIIDVAASAEFYGARLRARSSSEDFEKMCAITEERLKAYKAITEAH